MPCNAKTRSGTLCQKPPLAGKIRCRLHGGLSLSGESHWNYQHGNCTKEIRRKIVEGNAYIKLLEQMAISLGMIQSKR
ncbi:hypothetical protein DPM18_07995 [Polynucleobacter paneuropaeus]|uniref:HGGxSTG domain-containing protein n=1 Tax=Polynucleobacter paneuropaeus TaxID=2527775 RepID=UPI000DBF206B|nr:HGGxSTG domain-containing protein [Polynucleobacter paneuropaeus]AWW46753.1 hypothetical protein DPM18_07995 [Polynucleobacter paneuropaeus]